MVGQRGFSLIETTVALAVLVLIATHVTVGERAQLQGVTRSFEELRDSRAAAARIEELRAGSPFRPGEAVEIEPGLYEVTVTVRGSRLVTRIAR